MRKIPHRPLKLNSKSFEKEHYSAVDINSNKATCSSELEDPVFAAFQNVAITLYYYTDKHRAETMDILIREDHLIRNLIQAALAQINLKLRTENQLFHFDETISQYSVRLVKKNGQPRLDVPCFNHSTTIHNCHESKLALTWNSEATTHLIQAPSVVIDNNHGGNRKSKANKTEGQYSLLKKFKYKKEKKKKKEDDCIVY